MTTVVMAAQTVPLKNAGFEQTDAQGAPAGWQGSSKVYSVDSTVSRSGASSLKIHNSDLNVYELCIQTTKLDPNYVYQLSGWVKTEDIKGGGVRLAVELYNAQDKYMSGYYSSTTTSPGQWRQINKGHILISPDAASVRILCYLARGTTGTAWVDDVKLVRLHPLPQLHTSLLYPNYRGQIRQGSDQPIRVAGSLRATPAEAGIVTASLADRQGVVLQTAQKKVQPGTSFSLEVPVPPTLVPGDYNLSISLHPDKADDATPRQIESYPIEILQAEASNPTVWIDSHNRLMVRGQPMMPLGVYLSNIKETDAALLQDSAFNCVMPYARPTQAMLRMAQRHGFFVTASIKDQYEGKDKSIHTPLQAQNVNQAILRDLRDEPALLAWYTNDEFDVSWMPKLEKHYDWVKQMDPNHPAWMVLNHYNQVGQYMRAFDAVGTDPYPIRGETAISMVTDWTQTTRDQVHGARPIWQVIQTHNLGNYYKNLADARTPSPEEVRNMTWQAITNGANGIFYYSLFDMQRNPDRPFKEYWPKVKAIAAEVAQWAPILLSVEPSPKVSAVEPKDATWLSLRTATWQDRTFVFATNNTRQRQEARFHTEHGLDHVRAIDALDGNKQADIRVVDHQWRDTFEPLGVRMYELDGKGAALPPPQQVHPGKAK